ncbi:hypothetical protein MAR_026237 [Mya arenaria]|uniref:Uncharacterized protein n=1 Tax=Mya arenaria TaxID=6604 RepID=A0ABY7ET13_MYAAR|nr:uncharacterized protein LOC128242464 [Mya arenaria]WAR12057.1 hypothetical protein MAR_026237 [Mya arenaria]
MDKFEKFEINSTAFLRYTHVVEFTAEQDKKCYYFLKKCHPESEPSLLIYHSSISLIIQGKAISPEKIFDRLDVKHAKIDISTTDLKTRKTEKNACKPIIKVKQKSSDRQKVLVEFVQKGDFKGVKSKNTEFMNFECSYDEFISKVDLVLEQFALNQFKTKIEQLRRIREEIANNDISGGQTLKKRKLSIDQTTLRSGKSFHPSTESVHGGESIVLDEMEREVLTDTIRSGEALFRRRGNTTEAQEKYPVLTDEVSDGIFSTDQRIHGCGYRS